MKIRRTLLAASAAFFLTVAAFAADPTGTWTWSTPGREGRTMESSLQLTLKDGQLTGALTGGRGGPIAISDASFKDDQVAFKVTREMGGRSMTTKYTGKIEGATIKGSVEMTNREGEAVKRDWSATLAK